MSEVKIDLRDTPIPHDCTIDVLAVMANVTVIVPPGVSVDFDVFPVMASARNDAHELGLTPSGAPRVRVTGSAAMAEVRVRVRARGM